MIGTHNAQNRITSRTRRSHIRCVFSLFILIGFANNHYPVLSNRLLKESWIFEERLHRVFFLCIVGYHEKHQAPHCAQREKSVIAVNPEAKPRHDRSDEKQCADGMLFLSIVNQPRSDASPDG